MIIFENKGIIDPISIKTFGVSSKEGDSPIGFFGTGLKYAIAIILREGGSIKIASGDNLFEFTTLKHVIRNDEFELVCMNGDPMAFTTELGKTWEPWTAYRELYSNTMDEGGKVYKPLLGARLAPRKDGHTYIYVKGLDDFYSNHHKYFLSDDRSLVSETMGLQIFSGSSDSVYNHGIKCLELPTAYTYNFKGIPLTEDRTLKSSTNLEMAVSNAVMRSDDEEFIHDWMTCDAPFERQVSYLSSADFSEAFKNVCARLDSSANPHAQTFMMSAWQTRTLAKKPPKEVKISDVHKEILQRAIDFCHLIGFPVREYPIKVVELHRDIHGLAKHDTIYIDTDCFRNGAKYVASTLIEEFIHLRKGYPDKSTAMQTYLFDKIVEIGEQYVLRRPL